MPPSDLPANVGDAQVAFASSAFVLVGNSVNPANFKAAWLFQSGVLRPDEIPDSPVITPVAVQVENQKFSLLVLPGRVQLLFTHNRFEEAVEPATRILRAFMNYEPSAGFGALGYNLEYFVTQPKEFVAWNHRLFSCPAALVIGEAPVNRYGTYFSGDVGPYRMRVTVKPIHGVQSPNATLVEQLKQHPFWMHFAFNFHMDIAEESKDESIERGLTGWREAANVAESTIRGITKL